MEGEFSEVKRRTNNKVAEEKMKKQLPNVRGPADGQDDSSTKENMVNKSIKPSANSNKLATTANPNQIVACKAQSQEKPKVFGIDFLEAPLPKTNPWMRNQCTSSDLENGAEVETTCSKNTNAAELSEVDGSPVNRSDECSESNCHVDGDGKTDASPTKGRSFQRNAAQPETRTVPAHNSHQAQNPAYKTSNKPKNWDRKHKEAKHNADLNDSAQWPSLDIVTDKNKQDQASARPKLPTQKADESNESDGDLQTKPESPNGDIIDNINSQQMNKRKNKQKWLQCHDIEVKTERKRGGVSSTRGRGTSRPQYFNEDQSRRNNKMTYRKPNKTRDGSRQDLSDEVEARVMDENERNHCNAVTVQSSPTNRGMSFRGRRGRGRGGFSRAHRDSTNHVIEDALPMQPFFAPVYVSDEVEIQTHLLPEVRPEAVNVAEVKQSEQKEAKIQLQIEYYFSEKNLQKDAYLRHMMNVAGWVEVDVICAFPRVKNLGVNRDDVTRAMVKSTIVEMTEDGQKLRAKVEPAKWPLKPGAEIEDAHIPRWKELSSNSKLKADAPVFVPGRQYIPANSYITSQSSMMGNDHLCLDSSNLGQNERN